MAGMRLVTLKLPANRKHDPARKLSASCPVSEVCSDSTGAHHTVLIYTDAALAELQANYHVTRVEEV